MSNLGRQVSCFLYFVIDITVNYSVRIISKLLPNFMSNSIISIIMFICWVFFFTARKADTGWSSDEQYKVKKLQTGGDHPRGCNSHVSFGHLRDFPLFFNSVSSPNLTCIMYSISFMSCYNMVRFVVSLFSFY